jgi:cell wall-associated NlpC family hydrolase
MDLKYNSVLKGLFLGIFLLCILPSYFSCKTSKTPKTKVDLNSSKERDQKTAALLSVASSYYKTKYKNGGTNKEGMDCSGLVLTSFKAINLSLPRQSIEQSNIGFPIDVKMAQEGDLIFFATNGNSKKINHVGIISKVGAGNKIQFIHSTLKAGVMYDTLDEEYYKNSFVKIMRVY